MTINMRACGICRALNISEDEATDVCFDCFNSAARGIQLGMMKLGFGITVTQLRDASDGIAVLQAHIVEESAHTDKRHKTLTKQRDANSQMLEHAADILTERNIATTAAAAHAALGHGIDKTQLDVARRELSARDAILTALQKDVLNAVGFDMRLLPSQS